MTQITTLALVGMASLMTVGSISVFNFSNNLEGVPLSIIGVSYSLAAFPTLSQFITKNLKGEFPSHISAALRHTIFWSIPISVLFIVLRAQIVRVIYGAGKFKLERHQAYRCGACHIFFFYFSAIACAYFYPRILCKRRYEKIFVCKLDYRSPVNRAFILFFGEFLSK